jgi:plasmid stabilization system protein ParE
VPVEIDAVSALLGVASTAIVSIVLSIAANLLTPLCQSRIRRARDWYAKRSVQRAQRRIGELKSELESIRSYADSPQLRSAFLGEATIHVLLAFSTGVAVGAIALTASLLVREGTSPLVSPQPWDPVYAYRLGLALNFVAMFVISGSSFAALSWAWRAASVTSKVRAFGEYETQILSSIAALEQAAALDAHGAPTPPRHGAPVEPHLNATVDEAPSSPLATTRAAQLDIRSAKYGIGNRTIDVTGVLKQHVREDRLEIAVKNELLGSDPARGELKELRVVYSYQGNLRSAVVPEYEILSLPPAE